MQKLQGFQKQFLRSIAHHLKPMVLIGKQGLTDSLIASLNKALDDHELIKIKFVDLKDEKKELIEEIEKKVECIIVGKIGNMAILYRENIDEIKKKIHIPSKK